MCSLHFYARGSRILKNFLRRRRFPHRILVGADINLRLRRNVVTVHVDDLGLKGFGTAGWPAAVALDPLRDLEELLWFDICVGEQVGLEVGPLVEAPLTDGTPVVGGLLHVEDLVDGEGPRLTEPLAALSALEGLLLGVNVPVVSQVILTSKGFTTNITRIGSLVGVRALVDQEVVGLGELTVAEFADEPLLRPGRPAGSPEQSWVEPRVR